MQIYVNVLVYMFDKMCKVHYENMPMQYTGIFFNGKN